MTENKGSGGTNNPKDISEILKMLRDSVGKPVEEKPTERLDEDIEEKLKEKLNDAGTVAPVLEDSTEEILESGQTDEMSEKLEEEFDEELDEAPLEFEDISEEEIDDIFERDESDDAPWYSDDEEISEEEESDDEPWYSDDEEISEEEESDELDEEELTEEAIIDSQNDEDDGSKWYIDDASDETTDEIVEDEIVEDEIVEDEIIEDEIIEDEIIEDKIIEDEIIEDEIIEDEIVEDEIIEEENCEIEASEDAEIENQHTEAEEESTFDEIDISLLRSMGYNTVVDDNGDDEIVRKSRDMSDIGGAAYGHDGVEYESEDQSDDIIAGYKGEKKKLLVRLAATGGATLLLLIYEVLFFSGVTMPWIFNQIENPLAHIMVSLQLLVIVFAFSARSVCVGLKDLFTGHASAYSISATVIAVNLIYTLVVAVLLPEGFMLFNFMGALAVLFAVAHEYLLLSHEMKTFISLSNARSGNRFAFENDDCSGEVLGAPVRSLRAYRTEFNKDYFARTQRRSDDMRGLGILIAVVSGISLVSFVLGALFGSIGNALKTGVLIVNFAMPLATLCAFSLPINLASKFFVKKKGAVIGHSAADEYASVGFLTFDESDLFPSMKVSHVDFKPTGDMPVAEILRKTSLMFSQIGGPISRLVRIDAEEYKRADVEIRGIFDDGISAVVDGVEMLAGSARFLELYGVNPSAPTDWRDRDPHNGILYVAIGGKQAARYYINYRPDRDFVRMVNMLGDLGVAVGVRSHNPAVNSDVLSARCPEMRYKVYAIKSGSGERDDLTSEREETQSGICANKKAAFLAVPFVAAKQLKRIYRRDRILRAVSSSFGAALVIIMSLCGLVHEFNSVQAALCQLAWMLPSAIAAVIAFCAKKQY